MKSNKCAIHKQKLHSLFSKECRIWL